MSRIALCLLALVALCGGDAFAQRKLNERHAVVPDGYMRIFVHGGTVTVIGWEKDSLVVTGVVHEPPGDRFTVGVTPKGAKLGLWSDSDVASRPSSIVVYVPARSHVWVKTTSADVRVSSVTGGLDLFTVSGDIRAGGSPREVYAETMAGSIALDVTARAVRAKTAQGTLRVGGAIADLTAVTVSGAIDIVAASFQRARVESVDGDIRVAGGIPHGSALDVTNHAGNIDLLLPADATADFAVSLYSGDLVDEFGAGKKPAGGPKTKARELVFTLGEKPAARVTLRSFKGRVALRKL